jgi:hypothetical protein
VVLLSRPDCAGRIEKVPSVPVVAMLVACNLLIPKASWPDGVPLSLVARPMYLPGSGQLVLRLSDSYHPETPPFFGAYDIRRLSLKGNPWKWTTANLGRG